MARGINKVILVGNLGAEPEVRYMPSGDAVANVSLATSESWKDKQTGEQQERTEWHRLVFYSGLAKIVAQYLHKGSKIYAEGSIRTRKWTDKAGIERYSTEIIVNDMQMLDSRGSTADFNQSAPQQDSFESTNSAQAQPALASSGAGNFDDDIPF